MKAHKDKMKEMLEDYETVKVVETQWKQGASDVSFHWRPLIMMNKMKEVGLIWCVCENMP